MQIWTESTQEISRTQLEELSFACRDGKVWCKHHQRVFAYMQDDDAIRGVYQLYSPDGERAACFESIAAWLAAGWVLD